MAANSLRALTKRRLSKSEAFKVMHQFNDLDDRSCAIIAGALLEHGLERSLLRVMSPLSKDKKERLLFGTGPLATFSAKIRIAHAFGLIGPETNHDFEVLNDIRNAFAHVPHAISFRSKKVRDRLRGLHAMPAVNMAIRATQSFKDTRDRYNTTKGQFLLAVGGYIMALSARQKRPPRRLLPIDITLGS
jgi:DNA-binding MltR family transcriptional regulator